MTSAAPQPGQQPELPPTVTISSMLAIGALELLRMNSGALANLLAGSLQNEINQSVNTYHAIQKQLSDQAAADTAAAQAAAAAPPPPPPAPVTVVQPVQEAPPAVQTAMQAVSGEPPAAAVVTAPPAPVVADPPAEVVPATAVNESSTATTATAPEADPGPTEATVEAEVAAAVAASPLAEAPAG